MAPCPFVYKSKKGDNSKSSELFGKIDAFYKTNPGKTYKYT